MKTVIVYDSAYGNTARIAQAIALGLGGEVITRLVSEASFQDLSLGDLLIVGSPTQGGRATQPIHDFIKRLPRLDGIGVAAFDTRFAKSEHGFGLKIVMSTIGFAAKKVLSGLKAKGGTQAMAPVGFIVVDTKGPVAPKELEKAKAWGSRISKKMRHLQEATR